jgi:hypothetical protein
VSLDTLSPARCCEAPIPKRGAPLSRITFRIWAWAQWCSHNSCWIWASVGPAGAAEPPAGSGAAGVGVAPEAAGLAVAGVGAGAGLGAGLLVAGVGVVPEADGLIVAGVGAGAGLGAGLLVAGVGVVPEADGLIVAGVGAGAGLGAGLIVAGVGVVPEADGLIVAGVGAGAGLGAGLIVAGVRAGAGLIVASVRAGDALVRAGARLVVRDVEVVLGAAGLGVTGVEAVCLLDVELLRPPPATSTPAARPTTNAAPVTATTSHADRGIRLRRLASRPKPSEVLSVGLRSDARGIARPLLAR